MPSLEVPSLLSRGQGVRVAARRPGAQGRGPGPTAATMEHVARPGGGAPKRPAIATVHTALDPRFHRKPSEPFL